MSLTLRLTTSAIATSMLCSSALLCISTFSTGIAKAYPGSPNNGSPQTGQGAAPTVKEINPQSVEFSRIFNTDLPPDKQYVYDKDSRGKGCVIGCDQIDGVMAKWSTFFVQLQPYDKKCLFICHTTYPMPPREIRISTDSESFIVKMTEDSEYLYYLPLRVRKSITTSTSVIVQISGIALSTYKVGPKTLPLIAAIANVDEELPLKPADDQMPKTKSERLEELKSAYEKGLMSKSEYESFRMSILKD